MDKEQVFLQPAFILHKRPYRNTSAVIDVFTREYGRLSLIAKGVKQKKSALKSVLQNFQLLNISWVRRSDLGILTSAEFQYSAIQLSQENIYPALYLNELIIRLVQTFNPLPEVFDAYSDTLHALSQDFSVPVILRLFEKQMLQSLGYGFQLSYDADSHKPIEAHKRYSYVLDHGFVEAKYESTNNLQFKGAHLIAFDLNQIDQIDILNAVHQLTHINLRNLLGDKPLKSRELYKAFKAI